MNSDDTILEVLNRIHERLGELVRLTGYSQVEGLKQKEAVERLGNAGLSATSISEITGYATSSVAPVLSRAKKAKKGKA